MIYVQLFCDNVITLSLFSPSSKKIGKIVEKVTDFNLTERLYFRWNHKKNLGLVNPYILCRFSELNQGFE